MAQVFAPFRYAVTCANYKTFTRTRARWCLLFTLDSL